MEEENTQTHFGSFKRNFTRFVLNLLCRQILTCVALYSVWIAIEHYHYWFSWHVILSTLGYIPLMAESIMLFTGDELWSRQVSRQTKFFIHGLLVTVGTIVLTAGIAVDSYYTEPGFHFNTAHGITGLISLILVLLSVLIGVATNYSQMLKGIVKAIHLKAAHNIVGILGYAVGIMSLCFAYYTRWFVYWTSYESRLAALIFTIVATAWTVNGALVSAYNQIKTIFDN